MQSHDYRMEDLWILNNANKFAETLSCFYLEIKQQKLFIIYT